MRKGSAKKKPTTVLEVVWKITWVTTLTVVTLGVGTLFMWLVMSSKESGQNR